MEKFLGNFDDLINMTTDNLKYPLSFLNENNLSKNQWAEKAKLKLHDLLLLKNTKHDFNTKLEDTYVKDGVLIEHITYFMPYGPPMEGVFLKPENAKGKLPTVVALHDHSGYKYYGKEKIVELKNKDHETIKELKDESYGGESWANNLAKKGYGVFVPDLFLWGSRKIDVNSVDKKYVENVINKEIGSTEYIRSYNHFSNEYETIIAKTLFLSGINWPGLMVYEDKRAIDYICTRDDVDTENIGCGGLSGGGLRAIFLAAMDSRIKCAITIGFMSTFEEVVKHNITNHSWMVYLPNLSNYLDMPDVFSINENALMVQYNTGDELWTLKGQTEADEKLKKIYKKCEQSEKYSGLFYVGHHKFNKEMQIDAFNWFDKWLKNSII